jgi:hypothetical protein
MSWPARSALGFRTYQIFDGGNVVRDVEANENHGDDEEDGAKFGHNRERVNHCSLRIVASGSGRAYTPEVAMGVCRSKTNLLEGEF